MKASVDAEEAAVAKVPAAVETPFEEPAAEGSQKLPKLLPGSRGEKDRIIMTTNT